MDLLKTPLHSISKNVLRFAKLCCGRELINGINAKNSATEIAKFREHIYNGKMTYKKNIQWTAKVDIQSKFYIYYASILCILLFKSKLRTYETFSKRDCIKDFWLRSHQDYRDFVLIDADWTLKIRQYGIVNDQTKQQLN